jgi:hypothetical protein
MNAECYVRIMGGKPVAPWLVTLKGKENDCTTHKHRSQYTLFDKATGYSLEGMASISYRNQKDSGIETPSYTLGEGLFPQE